MIDLRIQGGLPDTRRSRHQPNYCMAETKNGRCDRPTTDRKPFCQRHITQSPYVENILQELKKQKRASKKSK